MHSSKIFSSLILFKEGQKRDKWMTWYSTNLHWSEYLIANDKEFREQSEKKYILKVGSVKDKTKGCAHHDQRIKEFSELS